MSKVMCKCSKKYIMGIIRSLLDITAARLTYNECPGTSVN